MGEVANHELAFGSLAISPAWALTVFVGTNTEPITTIKTTIQLVRSLAITAKS